MAIILTRKKFTPILIALIGNISRSYGYQTIFTKPASPHGLHIISCQRPHRKSFSSASSFASSTRASPAVHSTSTSLRDVGEGSETPSFWNARQDCWRPDVSDVERISWGKPAKKKGTGSRGIPHRLNEGA